MWLRVLLRSQYGLAHTGLNCRRRKVLAFDVHRVTRELEERSAVRARFRQCDDRWESGPVSDAAIRVPLVDVEDFALVGVAAEVVVRFFVAHVAADKRSHSALLAGGCCR